MTKQEKAQAKRERKAARGEGFSRPKGSDDERLAYHSKVTRRRVVVEVRDQRERQPVLEEFAERYFSSRILSPRC